MANRLPSEIERAILISNAHFPEAAHCLRGTIARAMRDVLTDADYLPNWHLSQLTHDGFPLEFAFTSSNSSVRFTTEVNTPGQCCADKLETAVRIAEDLSAATIDRQHIDQVRQWQACGPLKFGAWLGVRLENGHANCKVYAELPEQAEPAAMALLDKQLAQPLACNHRVKSLRMIGLNPQSGELEFYFTIQNLRPWEVVGLLGTVGLQSRHAELMDHLQWAYGRPIGQRLPGPMFGFSLKIGPARTAATTVFSLYTFTDALFRSGSECRRKLLRYYASLGQDMPCYAHMSKPAREETESNISHGLFGLAVTAESDIISHIGLRPMPEVSSSMAA